ncbi:MAG TPA: hypothetical protein VKA48_00650, partial [Gammaproteobacteria bacterium]|nr:hypothetical protein [Gammaproteobacteria bacterium]
AESFFPDDCVEMMREDVRGVSEILGIEFGPRGDDDEQHRTLMEVVAPVLRQLTRSGASSGGDLNVVTECITRMGRIRGSLG